MFGMADDHGSGYHPQLIAGGGRDHDGGWGFMWVFALVLIFLALIFLWGRRDDGRKDGNITESILPLIAANSMKNNDCSHYEWDNSRDMNREFGNIKMEIKEAAWTQSRENDKYHYETARLIDRNNYDTLLGFKNSEILGLQNTSSIEKRIDGLETRMKEDEIRRQGSRINYLETVMALSPKPPSPAYFPSYPLPVQYAAEPCCYPSHC